LAKNKRSRKWFKSQERKRKEHFKKQRKFESNPIFKRAKRHAIFGFVGFFLCLILVAMFVFMNKEIPTGVTLSGVVVDWAADGPKRRHKSKLIKTVMLKNIKSALTLSSHFTQ